MNEEIDKLRAALWSCATQAVALKQPCSDPDSPQAFMNAKYQAISNTAHIALGTIPGQAVSSERGYMARNLDVCNAYGLMANIAAIKERMEGKQFPRWLVEALNDAHKRASKTIKPLVEYRDLLEHDPHDIRGYVGTTEPAGGARFWTRC